MSPQQKLFHYISHSAQVGTLDDSEAQVGFGAAGQTGLSDVVHFYVAVSNGAINQVRFQAQGSAETLASAAYLAEQTEGQSLADAKQFTYQQIIDHLALSPSNRNSALLAEDAWQQALHNVENKHAS